MKPILTTDELTDAMLSNLSGGALRAVVAHQDDLPRRSNAIQVSATATAVAAPQPMLVARH